MDEAKEHKFSCWYCKYFCLSLQGDEEYPEISLYCKRGKVLPMSYSIKEKGLAYFCEKFRERRHEL